jgi:hypothetical protein
MEMVVQHIEPDGSGRERLSSIDGLNEVRAVPSRDERKPLSQRLRFGAIDDPGVAVELPRATRRGRAQAASE